MPSCLARFFADFLPQYDEEKFVVLPSFWIPADNLAIRVMRDPVPYDIWQQQGYLYLILPIIRLLLHNLVLKLCRNISV